MILSTQNPVDLDYKAMSNAGPGWWGVCRPRTTRSEFSKASPAPLGTSTSGSTTTHRPGEAPVRAEHYKVLRANAVWDALGHVLPRRPADQGSGVGPDERSIGARHRGGTETTEADEPAVAEPVEAGPLVKKTSRSCPRCRRVWPLYISTPPTWAGGGGRGPDRQAAHGRYRSHGQLTYDDTKAGVNHQRHSRLSSSGRTVLGPDTVREIDHDPRDFRSDPPEGAAYVLPEQKIDTKSFWTAVGTDLTNHLVGARKMTVFKNDSLKLYSRPGESRRISPREPGSGQIGGGRGHRQDAGDARSVWSGRRRPWPRPRTEWRT